MSQTKTKKDELAYYIGYWRPSQHVPITSTTPTTYPESNHPHRAHTFPFPRPNHFTKFWSLPENQDFIQRLASLLIRARKERTVPDSQATCHLCHHKFYDVFEYVYIPKACRNSPHPIHYYISSTYTHYLIDHKLTPPTCLQEIIKYVCPPKIKVAPAPSLEPQPKTQPKTKPQSSKIEDDWVHIEAPCPSLPDPLPV